MENHNQMNESIDRKESHFFRIPFALNLMGKSINQVLELCAAFNPELFTANRLSGADYAHFKSAYQSFDLSVTGSDIDESLKSFFESFDAKVSFLCTFELADYQAFSVVGINFVNNVAVECVVALGRPSDPERYSSEYEVLKVFLPSLEQIYRNGRVQQDDQEGRVYTWKKDENVVSFISYPPGSPMDTGVRLGVQIRDTRLHPHGSELELWYNEAPKGIANLKF